MGTASVTAERATATTAGRDAAPAPPGTVAQRDGPRDGVNVSELERVASAYGMFEHEEAAECARAVLTP
jgi:hypothetical protein